MSRDEGVWGRHHPLCGRMFLICAILSCGSWNVMEWSDCQEKNITLNSSFPKQNQAAAEGKHFANYKRAQDF